MKKILLLVTLFVSLYSSELNISTSELNPAFIKWQEQKELEKTITRSVNSSNDDNDTSIIIDGIIPSPIKPEIYKPKMNTSDSNLPAQVGSGSLPSKFDLSDPNLDGDRSDSNMTAITNQGSCGVCWAFAGYGALEGQLKIDHGLTYDLSEDNLKHLNGYEWSNNDPCAGGNIGMIMAYLSRGDGPISESDDPYDDSPSSDYVTDKKPVRYVDNVIQVPVRAMGDNTATYIKELLYAGKPLYTSMLVGWGTAGESGDSVWEASTKSFYYVDSDYSDVEINHAVVIVGWDDNYAAQGQTGAFIVRNSWGESWGSVTDGYFYVPYSDDSIARANLAYFDDKADDSIEFDKIYYYDDLGNTSAFGYYNGSFYLGHGANKFIASEDGVLTGIGLYVFASDTNHTIKVYSNITTDGSNISTFSNQVGTTQTANMLPKGYQTIKLNDPINISSGQDFIVAVEFTSATNPYVIPMEARITNYTHSTANTGESFYSGSGSTWNDLQDKSGSENSNINIKALVNTGSGSFSGNMAPTLQLASETPLQMPTDSTKNIEFQIDDFEDDDITLTGVFTDLSLGSVTGLSNIGNSTYDDHNVTIQLHSNSVEANGTVRVTATDSNSNETNLTINIEITNSSSTTPPITPPTIDINTTVSLEKNSNIEIPYTITHTESLTLVTDTSPSHGSISIDSTKVTYTPTTDYVGNDSFIIKTTDSASQTATKTVNITVVNTNHNSPVITISSNISVDEDNSTTISYSVTDVEDGSLNLSVGTNPNNGTVSIDSSNVTYTPNSNFFGSDTFVVKATDSGNRISTQEINVTVNSINDIPVLTVSNTNISINSGSYAQVSYSISDVEDSSLSLAIDTNPSNGSVSIGTTSFTYTPNNGFVGSDSFIVKTTDLNNSTVTKQINVTIKKVLSLNIGWNLVAIDTDLSNIGDIKTPIIWQYDNSSSNWSLHAPLYPSSVTSAFPAITTMDSSKGTWVLATSDFDLEINENNSTLDYSSYPLGWSLNGTNKDVNISDMGCSSGSLQRVWKYSNNSWSSDTSITKINANEGFWVYCQ
jgi:C1A family cysteine protease